MKTKERREECGRQQEDEGGRRRRTTHRTCWKPRVSRIRALDNMGRGRKEEGPRRPLLTDISEVQYYQSVSSIIADLGIHGIYEGARAAAAVTELVLTIWSGAWSIPNELHYLITGFGGAWSPKFRNGGAVMPSGVRPRPFLYFDTDLVLLSELTITL